jgi:hypothetical protein
MKKYKTHIIWGIVVVVALIGGFFWGKSMAATGTAGRGAYAGAASGTRAALAARFGGAGGAGGGFVAGTVSAIGNDNFTLQLANGNSENVYFSSSTSVVVPQTTSISAIQTGAMVMVGGTTDSSGNLTATTIQVRNGAGGSGGGAGTGPGAGGAGTGQY